MNPPSFMKFTKISIPSCGGSKPAIFKHRLLFAAFTASAMLLSSGCSFMNIAVEPVMNRFEPPEVTGDLGSVTLQTQVSEAAEVSMGEVDWLFGTNTVDDTDRMQKKVSGGLNVGVGVSSGIDIYLRTQGASPSMLGVKSDFLGRLLQKSDPKLRATTSFAVGYGGLSAESSSSLGDNYSSDVNSTAFDVSMNVGYRFGNSFLLYLNSFYSSYDSSGEIHHNGTLVLSDSGTGTAYGFLPGIMLGDKEGYSFIIEAGKSWINWSSLPEQSFDTAGVSLKYNW